MVERVQPAMVVWNVVGCWCFLLLVIGAVAQAQTPVERRFGVSFQAGSALHRADFRSLPGIPLPDSAQAFSASNGLSGAIGAGMEWAIFPDVFVGFQADVYGVQGTLDALEGPVPTLGESGIVDLTFRHSIALSLVSVGVQPTLTVVPVSPLSVRLGGRIAVPVWSKYEQSEEIIEPAGHEYVRGQGNRRIRAAGAALPEAPAVDLAFEAAVGYDIPLGNNLLLRPALSYRLGLTDRASGVQWTVNSLHGAIGVLWERRRDRQVLVDTVYRRDTTVQLLAGVREERVEVVAESVETEEEETATTVLRRVVVSRRYVRTIPRPAPLLAAEMNVRFVLNDGQETEGVRISVETVVEKNVVPLLPYIFFDEVSAELPSRYRQISREQAETFAAEHLDRDDVLAVYRHMLNIIGARLRSRRNATLTLTGTNADEGGEKRNLALSRSRAETVRSYLVERWGIAPERIAVRAVNLPAAPSNSTLSGGSEENRRVEISSNEPEILAPVFLQDTVRAANPPVVRFYPQVLSEAGIASWRITIGQGERYSKTFEGEGAPPEYIDWNISRDRAALVSADAPMSYGLRVVDLDGGVAETEQGTIVFQVRTQGEGQTAGSGEITRYSLIVFDYDGAALTRLHRSALAAIREALPAQADIRVVGMTDELGDEHYNKTLSERRAQAIATALNLPVSSATGIGEQADLPSGTPEGRFYSRRVDVLIRRHGSQ